MKVKRRVEKAGLKLSVQKMKNVAPDPITSWQIDGETMETVTDIFSWAPKLFQVMTAAMKLKDTCSFRMDWLVLLAVQWTLKSLLQHHSSKASILRC